MHRATASGAQPVELDLGPGAQVLGELAIAGQEGSVVAIVEGSQASRRDVLVVRPDGSHQQVNEITGPYDTPGYGEPLGPFVAISEDERLVHALATVTATASSSWAPPSSRASGTRRG